jgi:hypothetical protein
MTEETLYREKYVAFIDMLGFSSLVRASAQSATKQAAIVEAIERLKDTACCNPETDLMITYFSDCLVISSNRTPAGLIGMLQSIVTIAENLLVVYVLIRGGLAVGDIHHDTRLVFGPGLLDAYDMERCKVKHPTVLVSNQVKSDFYDAGLGYCLVPDDIAPDLHYVHYLIGFSTYDPTPRNGRLILDGPAKLIRHFIAQRLSKNEGSIREKAEWLERYWNRTVGAKGILGCVDRVGDLPRPDAHPFRSRIAIVSRSSAANR